MFILNSNRYARDPGGVSGKIPQMVEECNGEVLASRLWTEQKLAYAIEGHRKGTYWLSYFRMDSQQVAKFNRACQLNEDILRNLTLKVDPRLVDALVAHAKGERLPVPDDAATDEPFDDGDDDEDEDDDETVSTEADSDAPSDETAPVE
jgi:small subunit ribosomal protein S6